MSFDVVETCTRCGAPMAATAAPRGQAPGADGLEPGAAGLRLEPAVPRERRPARPRTRGRREGQQSASPPPRPIEMLDDDALEIGEEDLSPLSPGVAADAGMPFHIDEDLFNDRDGAGEPAGRGDAELGGAWQPFAVEPPAPAFVIDEVAPAAAGAPVIDRDEEIPECYWVPQIAGLGRRAGAIAADLVLLALLFGFFFAAAYLALEASAFDASLLFAAPGLRAALPPFALLALVLSLAYQVFFHTWVGRTPGEALTGVELRLADGGRPSRGRVLLRWACAGIGLAPVGVGFAWALIEPRRRSWADLLSGTVIARRQAPPAAEDGRR